MAATTKRAPTKAPEVAVAAVAEPSVVAYKGFDANMQCRGFQFAVGSE